MRGLDTSTARQIIQVIANAAIERFICSRCVKIGSQKARGDETSGLPPREEWSIE